jgi:hypothetical protein
MSEEKPNQTLVFTPHILSILFPSFSAYSNPIYKDREREKVNK